MGQKPKPRLVVRPARTVPVGPQRKFRNEIQRIEKQDIVAKVEGAKRGKLKWLQ